MSLVDASLRDAQVLDRGGYAYIVHPLTDGVPRCPPDLLSEWVDWAAAQVKRLRPDVLLAPEAMALPLVAPVSLRTGVPYVLARKRAYALPGEVAVASRTGYGASTLHLNGLHAGERVLVVDDVLSTGGTLAAVVAGVAETGAVACGALVFIDKGRASPAGVPVTAMRRVHVAAGRVVVDGSA